MVTTEANMAERWVQESVAMEVHVHHPLATQTPVVGDGDPVVLIGGGLTGWASWEPHAPRLSATRVARLQPLAVQYGLEDRPLPEDYSVRTESAALRAALDRLGWATPLDLVAWSYGAVVTLDFALDHPERVRTLTLIEPPAAWVLPDGAEGDPEALTLRGIARDLTPEVHASHLERFVRTVGLAPPDVSPTALPQWPLWLEHRRSLRAVAAPLEHEDDPARLGAFERPVLLVTGSGTSALLRRIHDELAARLPNAVTTELPGGHAPQLVSMEPFLETLSRFHRYGRAAPPAGEGKQTVLSRDGTPIAFWRTGHGPPLLLVHGATADHTTTWRSVLPELERSFTVYAMDRRGRGGSGDGGSYDLQREAEDIAAVTESIGEPVNVLGHSYGALAALEASLLTVRLRRLILYEGVSLRGTDYYESGAIEKLEAILEQGDVEGMLIALLRDVAQIPDDEVEVLRSQKEAWAVRLANAPATPRELRADRDYTFVPERFRSMRVPTLLLVGGDSPERELRSARGVADALPDARLAILDGQQHIAMHTAPERFVAEVLRFLKG
jgi:pimeloyl-ACP methyl ester carboxylesterase